MCLIMFSHFAIINSGTTLLVCCLSVFARMLVETKAPKIHVGQVAPSLPTEAVRRLSSPMIVGLHGGGVMISSRDQPGRARAGSSLFPDEEHSYEPRRHVRFAALSRNALPYAEPVHRQRRLRKSPPKRKTVPPPPLREPDSSNVPIPPTVQSLRKNIRKPPNKPNEETTKNQFVGRERYSDDPDSRELWGFSVRYSPKKQLEGQWRATQALKQRALLDKQEQITHQCDIALRLEQTAKTSEVDYAEYLYLASLYGPLDALLYCCCPPGTHGRVYRLLVDVSARRLQRWAPKRVAALHRYWIGYLAREVSFSSVTEGFESMVHSFHQQRQATALLQRLQQLRAASVLHAWHRYTVRMYHLREKIRLALTKDLETRFYQWRENVETRKQFRRQLKQIARRKAMQYAFEQWQVWRTKHEKMRCHLVQQWLKMKQKIWRTWCEFVRWNRSAKVLQRSWKLHAWRKRRDHSSRLIGRVYRGWNTRHSVKKLRKEMEIHSVLLRVVNVVVWENQCESLSRMRKSLLERNLARAREEAEFVTAAEEQATLVVDAELSKVLRNDMHRRLERHISSIQKDEIAVPVQAVKHSSSLRRIATQHLVNEQRVLARREAIDTFRLSTMDKKSSSVNSCLICEAYADCADKVQLSNQHKCLSDGAILGDGATNARTEVGIWDGSARAELSRLEQRELEYTQQLLSTEPPASLIWQSLKMVRHRELKYPPHSASTCVLGNYDLGLDYEN